MTNKLVVIINSLKVPKIEKILLYEMKFIVSNYSCLQNPWIGGYAPRSPFSLSSTEFVEPPLPPRRKNCWVRHCLSVPCTLGKGGQGRISCIVWSFLLYFFRTASLLSPNSQFCQPCTHPFSRGRVVEEWHNLNLDSFITLLDFIKIYNTKQDSVFTFAISWKRELRSYPTFVTKNTSVIF